MQNTTGRAFFAMKMLHWICCTKKMFLACVRLHIIVGADTDFRGELK